MEIRIAKNSEIDNVYALRVEVFVNEQSVPPEIELDVHDACATHIMAIEEDVIVGCARILFEGKEAHIGRLAVKKEYRGRGVGSSVCRYIIDYCKADGYSLLWLNSQLHAKEFYEKLGFKTVGDTFFEAGIEHVKMEMHM